MIQEIAKESPEIEYVRGDPDDYSEEKKQAIEVLANLAAVLPDNSRHGLPIVSSNEGEKRLVALKKSKVNAFNDRDGVLFYALREAMILQKLRGQRHVCQLLDVFYADANMDTVTLVTEYYEQSLEALQVQAYGSKRGRNQAQEMREESDEE